jgi:hypothetical protein
MVQVTRGELLDQFGRPMELSSTQYERIGNVRKQFYREFSRIQASYDAHRDGNLAFQNHWSNADHLSPNSANSYAVRRKIRSRSRFEVIENNPYLKGMVLTIANDFTGSGPKLQVTDKRVSKDSQRFVEQEFADWLCETRFRSKLWRGKIAKTTDGESFKIIYGDPKLPTPVKLNMKLREADHCTTEGIMDAKQMEIREVDGIEFDRFGDPKRYFFLDDHPGATIFSNPMKPLEGHWIQAWGVIHWYRKERAWNRGIPETAPSLSLCALLRRYTLAVVKAAEMAAAFSGVLESEFPPGTARYNEDTDPEDDFDTLPIEHGMFTVLPFGTKLNQMKPQQPVVSYDSFVNALLREISRPLLVPFNFASGSSKESNMASAVVDGHIYKEGHKIERYDCNDVELDHAFKLWLMYASTLDNYLPDDFIGVYRAYGIIRHVWRWDRVGLDHTDPAKVANALKTAHEAGHITDRDIQETYYNRNVEDWQEDVREQQEFREEIEFPVRASDKPEPEAEESTEREPQDEE